MFIKVFLVGFADHLGCLGILDTRHTRINEGKISFSNVCAEFKEPWCSSPRFFVGFYS